MNIDEPGYFERLARVEAGHWWSKAMWRLASEWLDRAIRGRRGLEAVDIGCGAGLSLIRLAGHREIVRVVGLEPDAGALRMARHHRGFELRQGSALELPFGDEYFDVATCFDVLQHLPDGGDRIAAREIARILRPGGVAVVRSNSAGFGRGRSSGGSAYRLKELIEIFSDAGLIVRRASYANSLPGLAEEIRGRLRFLAGLRGASWRAHPSGGGLRLDVPSPRVNRLMGAVSAFERRASGWLHCPLPFGHSTLILAEKPGGER
jgi:ubiquinone/menaquinone biosynthesis C-methylase UbiE